MSEINKTRLPRLSFKLLLIINISLNGTTAFCPHALFVSTNSKSTVSAMRGIAFDWARYDPTQAHVYSVEAFSKKLVDLGVEHEAEEYLGDPWNKIGQSMDDFFRVWFRS